MTRLSLLNLSLVNCISRGFHYMTLLINCANGDNGCGELVDVDFDHNGRKGGRAVTCSVMFYRGCFDFGHAGRYP